MAFNIPEGQEVKDFGFTVYDAETGDPINGDFTITHNGELVVYLSRIGLHVSVEKGKYIIQFFPSGMYMRY